MKFVSVLICTIAFAYLVMEANAQQKCRYNGDCTSFCGGDPDHANPICDVPSGLCHCHDHAEINCSNDQICKSGCNNQAACCHNDHHCHCNEPCTSG